MLAMQSKHAEAGQILIDGLSGHEREFSSLSAEEKRLATMAAAYFSKAGEAERAARVYELLGEPQRAALSRSVPASERFSGGDIGPLSGRPQISVQPASELSPVAAVPTGGPIRDAAMARAEAKQLAMNDRKLEAAELLAAANLHYEAGLGFIKAGEGSRALSHLMLVAQDEPQYPIAAKTALRLLTKMGRCTSTFVSYLRPSIAQGPETEDEITVFQSWSELLVWRGYIGEARATVDAILAKFPKDAHSLALRARLDETARSATISLTDEQRLPSTFSEAAGPPSSPFTERSPQFGHTTRGPVPEFSQPPAAGPKLPSDRPSQRREPSSNVRVSLIPPTGVPDRVVLGPGVVIGERFRLQAEIGRGGMATVFSAVDQELDEELAIKVFSGDLVTQDHLEDAVARFREELKLCRKLNHPNIIQVYDIGIHGGHRYFTMELLRGRPLDELLTGPREAAWALPILIQACNGLSVAHARGVIHRDIKPANLFVTNQGVLKIMDFGIAKSDEKRKKTMLGTMAGTPAYMAPEQIMGFSSVGPAADQYALGILAYEMLTGNLPFYHEDMMPLLMMHREQAPEPLSRHVPGIDPELEAAVLKMLAKLPEDRFKTCEEAARTLDAIQRR